GGGAMGKTDQASGGNQQAAGGPPGTVPAETQPSVGLKTRPASSGHFNAPRFEVGCHRSCSIVRPAAAVTTLFALEAVRQERPSKPTTPTITPPYPPSRNF